MQVNAAIIVIRLSTDINQIKSALAIIKTHSQNIQELTYAAKISNQLGLIDDDKSNIAKQFNSGGELLIKSMHSGIQPSVYSHQSAIEEVNYRKTQYNKFGEILLIFSRFMHPNISTLTLEEHHLAQLKNLAKFLSTQENKVFLEKIVASIHNKPIQLEILKGYVRSILNDPKLKSSIASTMVNFSASYVNNRTANLFYSDDSENFNWAIIMNENAIDIHNMLPKAGGTGNKLFVTQFIKDEQSRSGLVSTINIFEENRIDKAVKSDSTVRKNYNGIITKHYRKRLPPDQVMPLSEVLYLPKSNDYNKWVDGIIVDRTRIERTTFTFEKIKDEISNNEAWRQEIIEIQKKFPDKPIFVLFDGMDGQRRLEKLDLN